LPSLRTDRESTDAHQRDPAMSFQPELERARRAYAARDADPTIADPTIADRNDPLRAANPSGSAQRRRAWPASI
jgi:hypothetical protein